jgi:hypothetical protein
MQPGLRVDHWLSWRTFPAGPSPQTLPADPLPGRSPRRSRRHRALGRRDHGRRRAVTRSGPGLAVRAVRAAPPAAYERRPHLPGALRGLAVRPEHHPRLSLDTAGPTTGNTHPSPADPHTLVEPGQQESQLSSTRIRRTGNASRACWRWRSTPRPDLPEAPPASSRSTPRRTLAAIVRSMFEVRGRGWLKPASTGGQIAGPCRVRAVRSQVHVPRALRGGGSSGVSLRSWWGPSA